MKGGHNRKSPRQKRLSGTYRRDRDTAKKQRRARAVRAAGQRGVVIPFPVKALKGFRPPLWLGRLAIEKWYELARKLLKHGLLTELTEDVLAMACNEWAGMVRLTRRIEREGEILKGYRGYLVKHPASLPLERRTKRYLDCLVRMGMTPVDARRVDLEEPADADDAFFSQQQSLLPPQR